MYEVTYITINKLIYFSVGKRFSYRNFPRHVYGYYESLHHFSSPTSQFLCVHAFVSFLNIIELSSKGNNS